jgi:hypothetical protein
MIGAQLLQECAVLKIVMDQVRRPGDAQLDSPRFELGGQIAQRL